jgi:hypothetical protein
MVFPAMAVFGLASAWVAESCVSYVRIPLTATLDGKPGPRILNPDPRASHVTRLFVAIAFPAALVAADDCSEAGKVCSKSIETISGGRHTQGNHSQIGGNDMSHTTANKGRCILAALAAVAVLSASGCRLFFPPFRRNPKLRLLRSEHMGSGSSLSHPVVSPDGAQVYYLSSGHPTNIGYFLGTLWRTGFNDTGAVQVSPDTFGSMAISPDGRLMVLGTYSYGPSRKLVTIDLGTWAVETIPSAEDIAAWDVEFSRTVAGRVYYSNSRTGLHRIDVDGNNEVLVDSTVKDYFDLTPSDSVVRDAFTKPKVDPGDRYVACMLSSTDPNIAVIDLTTGDTTLNRANPYKTADMEFPYWTPDGQSLVFGAAEWRGEPHGTNPAELWVFDDVLKKGKE